MKGHVGKLFLLHVAKMAAVREWREYSPGEASGELGIARNEADARTYSSQSLLKAPKWGNTHK